VRIKHRLGKNSIKLYDKAYTQVGAVLRPEVTLNAPQQFRVFRHKAGEPEDVPIQWRPLRAGIADLHRCAEVSQKALDRYCTALAQVDDTTTLRELTQSIEKPVRWNGRPVRAFRRTRHLSAAYGSGRMKSSQRAMKPESSNTPRYARY